MAIQIKSSFTKSTLHAYARILYYEAVQILLTSLTLILVLEKQRYFDRIVLSISTLEGQLKFYLNIQEEIMLKYDPDINTKLNATIEDLKVTYIPLTHYYSPLLLFYTRWKHQKTFRFSDVFRGYRKTTLGCNGLRKNQYQSLYDHLFIIIKWGKRARRRHLVRILTLWKWNWGYIGACPCHCAKSGRIQNFSGPYFPVFGFGNFSRSVYFCIQSVNGTIYWPDKTISFLDIWHGNM